MLIKYIFLVVIQCTGFQIMVLLFKSIHILYIHYFMDRMGGEPLVLKYISSVKLYFLHVYLLGNHTRLTTPHLTTPHLTKLYRTKPHNTASNHAAPHHTSPHKTTPHHTTTQYTTHHNTTPHNTTPQQTLQHQTSPHCIKPRRTT